MLKALKIGCRSNHLGGNNKLMLNYIWKKIIICMFSFVTFRAYFLKTEKTTELYTVVLQNSLKN